MEISGQSKDTELVEKEKQVRKYIQRIMILVLLLFVFVLGSVVTQIYISSKMESNSEESISEESISEELMETVMNEGVGETVKYTETEVEEYDGTVSIYSWYFELTNQPLFSQLAEPLKQLGITRIYQLMSAESVEEPETLIMMNNLKQLGIETVPLTGSATWIKDGVTECEMLIDGIVRYNQNTVPNLRINAIAVDVEVHTLPEWKNDAVSVFGVYVELMKHIKDYANKSGIKVIQVIPTTYDKVNKELFEVFLRECCDEISVMNYNRKTALNDIAYEVEKAKEFGISIETIFETMPLSEVHAVTSDMTYYYDGMDALQDDVEKIRGVYGKELGISYHHYTTLYELCKGDVLGEITLFADFMKNDANPGNVVLKGEDGSVLFASPYWPLNKKERKLLGWLVPGVKENIKYNATYYELYSNTRYVEEIVFLPGMNGKLQAVAVKDENSP